jgi:hypothetical protein
MVNDRIATKSLSTALNFDYRLTDRINVKESLNYSDTSREFYSDQETLSNNLSLAYEGFLRGTSLILGHTFTVTNTSGNSDIIITDPEGNPIDTNGLDQHSHNVSLGLSRPLYGEVTGTLTYGYSILERSSGETTNGETESTSAYISASINGPFLPRNRFPKLTSSASISYSQPATAGVNDDSGKFVSGHMNLGWSARERTKLHVRASRSMDLAANDFSVQNTRIGAGFDQHIGRSTHLSGSVGYRWSTYRGADRDDNSLDASLGLSRSFNKYLSASLGYTYQDNNNSTTGLITSVTPVPPQ